MANATYDSEKKVALANFALAKHLAYLCDCLAISLALAKHFWNFLKSPCSSENCSKEGPQLTWILGFEKKMRNAKLTLE